MSTWLLLTWIVLLIAGIPVALSLGMISLLAFVLYGQNLLILPQRLAAATDSFVLLSIPFFILAGKLVNRSGITDQLFDFAKTLVGFITGGLAHVNVLASIIFSGMSGAAVADIAGLGEIEIEAMEKEGYERDFAAAVTLASSLIGPIIPPSIAFVVYGSLASTSVGALFLGGILPGLLMGLSLMIYIYIVARRRNYPRHPLPSVRRVWDAFRRAFLGLLTPVIVIGGIMLGIFTPTEAAVVVVMYALFLGTVVYRTLSWREVPTLLLETVETTGIILFIMANAAVFSWALTVEQVPQKVAALLTGWTTDPLVLLLLVNVLLLLVGCVMDGIAAMTVLVPILLPVLRALHIDPVHFGVLMNVNLVLGLMTPPVGVGLFAAAQVAKLPVNQVFRAVLPFFIPLMAVLLLVTLFPDIVLFLPKTLLR